MKNKTAILLMITLGLPVVSKAAENIGRSITSDEVLVINVKEYGPIELCSNKPVRSISGPSFPSVLIEEYHGADVPKRLVKLGCVSVYVIKRDAGLDGTAVLHFHFEGEIKKRVIYLRPGEYKIQAGDLLT